VVGTQLIGVLLVAEENRQSGGSGTGADGIENEGTGSLRVPDQKDRGGNVDPSTEVGAGESETSEDRQGGSAFSDREGGSGSTEGGRKPGVSGQRGVTGGTEKEGEGHSGPIRSGRKKRGKSPTNRHRATVPGGEEGGAREGYEDHGGSRDDLGTSGESSGSRPESW
jgi:hypothetical protein